MVNEIFPANVFTLFGCFEILGQESEFSSGNYDLGHVEPDAELRVRDEASSEFVKISEEFTHADSLLGTHRPNAGYRVIEVVGIISNYLGIANEGLSFGEIGKTVVEISSNAIKLLATVDIVAEINVVHLINVTLIHVTS